jgi:BirA family biotin operon repressor/biotin-[acetyl-CoA-carboxylase] ligase
MGIGINVHQRHFDPNLATPATSLDLESGRIIDRQQLLIALLESLHLETQSQLAPGAGKTIRARLERASTWIRGRAVEVHGPQACMGLTEGLDEQGFLLVRTPDGLVQVQTGGIRQADNMRPGH